MGGYRIVSVCYRLHYRLSSSLWYRPFSLLFFCVKSEGFNLFYMLLLCLFWIGIWFHDVLGILFFDFVLFKSWDSLRAWFYVLSKNSDFVCQIFFFKSALFPSLICCLFNLDSVYRSLIFGGVTYQCKLILVKCSSLRCHKKNHSFNQCWFLKTKENKMGVDMPLMDVYQLSFMFDNEECMLILFASLSFAPSQSYEVFL